VAGNWWENEIPEVVESKFVAFKYYREAGKLQVVRRILTQNGERLRTVTLSRKDFDDKARRLLASVLTDWQTN